MSTMTIPRPVRAPRGTRLQCRGWGQEAALRMLMNNLDPEVAEDPDRLVVYGGAGKAAMDAALAEAFGVTRPIAPGSMSGRTDRGIASEQFALHGIDDTAEKYADLKPYQYHGSIYGVVPAERGHLRPVGEWNTEEISCIGRRVVVVLNGETIVDVDLDKVAPDGKTIDGNNHPGLKRDKGHIGFLGHGARIEFRNLRIKEIERK